VGIALRDTEVTHPVFDRGIFRKADGGCSCKRADILDVSNGSSGCTAEADGGCSFERADILDISNGSSGCTAGAAAPYIGTVGSVGIHEHLAAQTLPLTTEELCFSASHLATYKTSGDHYQGSSQPLGKRGSASWYRNVLVPQFPSVQSPTTHSYSITVTHFRHPCLLHVSK
jgi:hypothetical protein